MDYHGARNIMDLSKSFIPLPEIDTTEANEDIVYCLVMEPQPQDNETDHCDRNILIDNAFPKLGRPWWGNLLVLKWSKLKGMMDIRTHEIPEIRQRLKIPFVDDISTFFILTKDISAVVVGSAAWNVLSIDDVTPKDLNIIVPDGSQYGLERLKAYLTCSGSTVDFDGCPSAPYDECATRFVKLRRTSGAITTITLSKTSSIVPVLVSSSFTSQYNILTPTHLYCFYPNLLSRREAVRGMVRIHQFEVDQLARRGIQYIGAYYPRNAPCEYACACIWRRTSTLEGVALMHWAGFDGSGECGSSCSSINDIGDSDFKWRLGLECVNPRCPNSMNVALP
ncbi:hypothetical protein BYT27DRAFT_7264774 [Phlegmacium glaucopus]|nr:hypothetical protein BYT27DRAFT_7264774 [Phlegmacium glaucopus]